MPRKTLTLFAAVVIFISALAGCSGKQAAKTAAPEAPKYQTYTAPDGTFSVDIPAGMKVEVEKQEMNTALGKATLTTYTAQSKNAAYMVSSLPLNVPVKDEATIKEALKRGIKGTSGNGTILEEKELTVGANPAIQALISLKRGEKDIFINTVHFFIKGTQFQFQVVGFSKEGVSDEDAAHYFASIKPGAIK